MNYPAMRWAVEGCQLDGVAKPILFVIAYRANRDTGECWASQRRIAKEAGVSRKSVERWLPRLVAAGVLEFVEEGTGPQPDRYRFSPGIIEGESFGTGIVEGSSTASNIVEGEAIAGEVIHNPGSSGDMVSPVGFAGGELVATSGGATGDIPSPPAGLVVIVATLMCL